MEEDKVIKRKRIFRMLYKTISYTFILILMIVAGFFITYFVTVKIAEKKGENPSFGMYTIISPSMTPSIDVYDVVFVKKVDPSKLKVNDVITFYSSNAYLSGTPITHRIVEILNMPDNETMFMVKGDANERADDEKVYSDRVLGKVLFKFPKLGKLQYFLASKGGFITAILIPSILIILYDAYKLIKLIILKNKLLRLGENSLL